MPLGSAYSKLSSSYVAPKRDQHHNNSDFSSSGGKAANSNGAINSSSTPGKQVYTLIANQDASNHQSAQCVNGQSTSFNLQQSKPSKTVLVVKCTDTSIKAFNQAIAAQKLDRTRASTVTFKNGGGSLNLPLDNGDGSVSTRSLGFKLSKLDSVAGLECLVERVAATSKTAQRSGISDSRGPQMVSVGEIAQNARIEGTDEIFQQTKQRMNQVEQDYKKVSTKSIDNFGKNRLSGVTKKKTIVENNNSSKNKLRMETAVMASGANRPVTTSKLSVAPGQRESRFSGRPDGSSNHSTSISHGIPSHLIASTSSANNSRVLHSSQASQNSIGGHQISSSTEELLASSSIEYPGRISNVAVSETTPNHQLSGNSKNRSLQISKNQSSPPKKLANIGNNLVSEQSEERSKMSPTDMEVSRVMATSTTSGGVGGGVGSNSNSPKSTTSSEGATQFTLKDHIMHLLAAEDGMAVNSIVFRLKSQCKLRTVQYQQVVNIINEVATNENRATNVYSLKPEPSLTQLVLTQQIRPHHYTHYSTAQRNLLLKKLERLKVDPGSINRNSSPYQPPETSPPMSLAPSPFLNPNSSSTSSSGAKNPAVQEPNNPNKQHNQHQFQPPAVINGASVANETGAGVGSQQRRSAPDSCHAVAESLNDRLSSAVPSKSGRVPTNQESVPDCFRNLIDTTSTQRKRPIDGGDSDSTVPANSNQPAHHNSNHHNTHLANQKGGGVQSSQQLANGTSSGGNSNTGSDLKRFRPSNEPMSDARDSNRIEPPSNNSSNASDTAAAIGNQKSNQFNHESHDRKQPPFGNSTTNPPFGVNKKEANGSERVSEEVVIVGGNVLASGGDQSGLGLQGNVPGKELAFAQCLAKCKYCIEDPLKDFAELKSLFGPVQSREEYCMLQEQFKREYSTEFQPLRKKVTETKKLFRQLKDDFDAAKMQYSKLADDEANRAQLEQQANNVIQVHEKLFRQEDFLKTNHRCCQLHNQLSVMLSRLQDFRNREIQHIMTKQASPSSNTNERLPRQPLLFQQQQCNLVGPTTAGHQLQTQSNRSHILQGNQSEHPMKHQQGGQYASNPAAHHRPNTDNMNNNYSFNDHHRNQVAISNGSSANQSANSRSQKGIRT